MNPNPVAASKKRILSIQACRGIAVLAVVLSHISGLEQRYFNTVHTILFRLGNCGVDLFFIISGVVISLVTTRKFDSARNAGTFLYHRMARIYPVFWIYFALAASIFFYKPSLVNALAGHKPHLLSGFFLIPTESPNLIVQSWTLGYEIAFYIIFSLLMCFFSEKMLPVLLGAWAAMIVAASILHAHIAVFLAPFISPLDLEFIAGCVLYMIFKRTAGSRNLGYALLSGAFLWMLFLAITTYRFHGSNGEWIDEHYWTRVELFGPFAFMFLWGCLEMERHFDWFGSRQLEAIGDWSYSIYLSHIMLIAAVGRPIARVTHGLPFGLVGAYCAIVPLVLLLGYFSYNWVERPLIDWLYRRPPSKIQPGVPTVERAAASQ
jgi:exopolysaccharide production protein ExoZ